MAGGIFTTYNKIRPGAYINMKGMGSSSSSAGTRGGMTMPLDLDWGEENSVIRIDTVDFINGKALSSLGISMTDEKAFILKLALQNCSYALIYRSNSGGVAAEGEIGGLKVKARYPGIFGNRIAVAIKDVAGGFNVITYVDNVEKDSQSVSSAADLSDNEWVVFDKSSVPNAAAAEFLKNGANGTADSGYDKYFAEISGYNWNTMAVPGVSVSEKSLVKTYIQNLREKAGKKVQAVLVDYAEADYEGILSVSQGYKTKDGTVTPEMFSVYAAGLTAGTEINKSNTYHVITDAVTIINPMNDSETEEALAEGKLVLSRRQDGMVIIEKDINSLHMFTPDKGYIFSKNRVIRCLDDIANSIKGMFENYIGKVDNSDSGRAMFKGEVIGYLSELQDIGALQNFDGSEDVEVRQGNDADSIIVDLFVQPTDAMEKLYMTVSVE